MTCTGRSASCTGIMTVTPPDWQEVHDNIAIRAGYVVLKVLVHMAYCAKKSLVLDALDVKVNATRDNVKHSGYHPCGFTHH